MKHLRPLETLVMLVPVLVLGNAFPARAELPPLVPRELLFANPSRINPSISPDGTRLAYLAATDDKPMNVWVETVGKDDGRMVTADERRGIYDYGWAHDNRHILYIQDRDGDENWHVYSADVETDEVKDLTPFDGVRAQNMITDRNHPEQILVGLNKRDPSSFDMYRVNIVTGEVTLEAENPGDVDAWMTDAEFRIRAATALHPESNDTIIRVRDGADSPWRDLVQWDFYEVGSVLYKKVIGFTPDGKGLYVQSPMNSEMTRLVILDVTTGEEVQELAASPESDLWNIWWEPQVMIDPRTHVVEAVGFCYLKPRWEILDPSVKEDFERLAGAGEGIFHVMDRTHDDTRWLVEYTSDVIPASYVLYDRTSGEVTPLFDALPELSEYTLAPMQGVTYTARDGTTIPAYLTLPVGVEAKDLPLVMLPHGGPWARDQWGFDPWTQLLANRGYAVLQPNFRGSTGYGKNYLNAGNEQWGVGNMQHDLTDGVKWAVEQGIVDGARVAIMGGSYGGYATLSGMAFTPELYRCGIDMVGPANVKTLFESFPPYWSVRKRRWVKRVGNVEEDEEWNRRISPLFHAASIRAPMLIAHGANDVRVKQAESDAIVEAMKGNNLSVTYVVYPDEGHGLARPANNMDFMGRVEEFLGEHLGGRKEPWREEPGTSAEVRWPEPPRGP